MLIMNDKALEAVINHNFKFGADAGVALGTLGRGISGSTTAAVGADIVTIARARELFAGISLDGSFTWIHAPNGTAPISAAMPPPARWWWKWPRITRAATRYARR